MKPKKILEILNNEDLLNDVGVKLLENMNLFPNTIENIRDWTAGESDPLQAMATSSLVGPDDEHTIEEWIEPEERDTMRKLLQGMDIRTAKVQVKHPGGNASKGSRTYSMTLPATWMQELGITKEERKVILSYDGEKIIIESGNTN